MALRMKLYLQVVCCVGLWSWGLCAAGVERPNVLFVLVDDLGVMDVGYAGSTFYETPHIDALASKGMVFEQGYAASRVCSPSRASIMLGQTPARHGITQWIGDVTGWAFDRGDRLLNAEYVRALPAADVTLAEAFQAGGYRTFFAGKWHLGGPGSWPEDHGFEINRGGWDVGGPRGGYFAPWENPRLEGAEAGESLTMRLAAEAAAFVRGHAEEPFLAFLSFYTVHGPLQTSEERWRYFQQKAVASALPPRAHRFVFDRRLPVRVVQDHPVYAGMVQTLDDAVGVVLEALEEAGVAEETIVVFTSDNGGVVSGDAFSTSMQPFRGGKGRQWEGGIREPYIVYVPWLMEAGGRCDVPVTGMDFYPTLLELAHLPMRPEQHCDGMSLVPLMRGGRGEARSLFWHYPHYGNQGGEPSSIIRSGRWKLIFYHEDGRCELYDLETDVGESVEVSDRFPEQVRQLKEELDDWLDETGAVMPKRDPRFTEERFRQRLKQSEGEQMRALERQAEAVLRSDWRPNADWWGSGGSDGE